MGDHTTIEWTDATWNPVRGCAIVSKGCTNCYAMRQAHRSSGAGGAYEGLTKLSKGGPVWTGKVRLVPELLEQPLRWRRPRRIFVNSMSDLFHEDVPLDFIAKVFEVMNEAHWHIYQVLTKRSQRAREVLSRREWPWAVTFDKLPQPNVWLGVSVEDQVAADERIPQLLATPAAVRWISAEPLLGRVDLRISDRQEDVLWRRTHGGSYVRRFIDWVVAGGESGPGARPMHPDWARSLRDQCAAAGVPFFFKQWGGWMEVDSEHRDPETGDHRLIEVPGREADDTFDPSSDCLIAADGRVFRKLEDLPPDTLCRQMTRGPKKWCGRELDGRTHDEYPA